MDAHGLLPTKVSKYEGNLFYGEAVMKAKQAFLILTTHGLMLGHLLISSKSLILQPFTALSRGQQ